MKFKIGDTVIVHTYFSGFRECEILGINPYESNIIRNPDNETVYNVKHGNNEYIYLESRIVSLISEPWENITI